MVKGKVTKLTNFGVFVELEPGLEGLLHISELADHKVENPEDVVKVGDEIEVKILRVDRRRAQDRPLPQEGALDQARGEEGAEGEATDPAAPRAEPASAASKELKGGLGGGGPLFSMGSPAQAESETEPQAADARRRDSGGRRDRRCADERRHSRVTAAHAIHAIQGRPLRDSIAGEAARLLSAPPIVRRRESRLDHHSSRCRPDRRGGAVSLHAPQEAVRNESTVARPEMDRPPDRAVRGSRPGPAFAASTDGGGHIGEEKFRDDRGTPT